MPYKSEAQNRFVHAKAAEGKQWAQSFVEHSHGSKVPKVEHVKPKKSRLHRVLDYAKGDR